MELFLKHACPPSELGACIKTRKETSAGDLGFSSHQPEGLVGG